MPILLLLLLLTVAPVEADVGISIGELEPYALEVRAFELSREVDVDVDVTGMRSRESVSRGIRWWWNPAVEEELSVYAWLLDATTRRPVWIMHDDESEEVSTYLRRATRTLRLGPGRYELYLFSGNSWISSEAAERQEAPGFWERLTSLRRSDESLREAFGKCRATLKLRGIDPGELLSFEPTGEPSGTLLRLAPLGDGRLAAAGFEIARTTRLRVSSTYERTRGSRPADYGWIVDERTREVVWRPTVADEEHAGGASKNRRVDRVVELRPGRYDVYFGTDDSHSFDRFNANPPVDPFAWGITLLAQNPAEPPELSRSDVRLPAPLIEHRQVGDRAFFEEPFRLDRDGALHVVAYGEYSDRGEFVDSAWIVASGTGRTVWEMTERNTMGAGGADKNRRFDGLVPLSRGEYVLYYATDGSHSHDGWNSAAPFEPDGWGLTVRPGPDFDLGAFRRIDAEELAAADDLLVRLQRVGDDARVEQVLRLDRATTVEIRAVGEGRAGEMYDYGLVVDQATGRAVWEMSYAETGHAGGAEKNREARVRLTLAPGSYDVIYRSDGSHSFAGWNATRPDDPISWGITIRRVEPVAEDPDAM